MEMTESFGEGLGRHTGPELCVGGRMAEGKDRNEALDQLLSLSRRKSIHKQLAQRHLKDGCLVMYDTSSSYMEGAYKANQLRALSSQPR